MRTFHWLAFSHDYSFIITAKFTAKTQELIRTVLLVKKVKINCVLSANHNKVFFLIHVMNTLVLNVQNKSFMA